LKKYLKNANLEPKELFHVGQHLGDRAFEKGVEKEMIEVSS